MPIGWAVRPLSARSARISPTTEANLKPWPGEAGREHHLRMLRVDVDQEVTIRRQRVDAGRGAATGPSAAGRWARRNRRTGASSSSETVRATSDGSRSSGAP